MNIQDDRPYKIYIKDYEGKRYYKVKISKKQQDGTYDNGYMDIRFKEDKGIKDKDIVYLRNAFLTYWKDKEKITHFYIQVMDYETMEQVIEHSKETDIVKNENVEKDLFEEFGEEHKDDDLELPF